MTNDADSPAISTKSLTKAYGKIRAVNDLSINVPKGTIYGFLGRNGAGKTTTIKLLLGLLRPSTGSVRVLGFDPQYDLLEVLSRAAYVPETPRLYQQMTGHELLRIARGFYPGRWSDAVSLAAASKLDVPLNRPWGKLSRGNKTKISLLLAFGQSPDLLILDEPTAGLDPVSVYQLNDLLREQAKKRVSIFFSSHQLELIEEVANYVGILVEGHLCFETQLYGNGTRFRYLTVKCPRTIPTNTFPGVTCLSSHDRTYRFIVSQRANEFASALEEDGATIMSDDYIDLRRLFLEIVTT